MILNISKFGIQIQILQYTRIQFVWNTSDVTFYTPILLMLFKSYTIYTYTVCVEYQDVTLYIPHRKCFSWQQRRQIEFWQKIKSAWIGTWTLFSNGSFLYMHILLQNYFVVQLAFTLLRTVTKRRSGNSNIAIFIKIIDKLSTVYWKK
jgi:hypothetical protein